MYKPEQQGPYPQHRFDTQNTIIAGNIINAAANVSNLATLFTLLNTATSEEDLATQTLVSQGTQDISANAHIALGVAVPIANDLNIPYLCTLSGTATSFNGSVRAFPFLARSSSNVLTAGYAAANNPSQNFELLPLQMGYNGIYSVNAASVVYPTDDTNFLFGGWIYQNSAPAVQQFIPNQSISLHRYLRNIDTVDPVR